jgi:hypothetical protein
MFAVEGHRIESASTQILQDLQYKVWILLNKDRESAEDSASSSSVIIELVERLSELETKFHKLEAQTESNKVVIDMIAPAGASVRSLPEMNSKLEAIAAKVKL